VEALKDEAGDPHKRCWLNPRAIACGVRRQKSEVRSQKSEVRSQKSEVCPLSSVFCSPGTGQRRHESKHIFIRRASPLASEGRNQKSEICPLFSVLCRLPVAGLPQTEVGRQKSEGRNLSSVLGPLSSALCKSQKSKLWNPPKADDLLNFALCIFIFDLSLQP
jgi:hypothetical protein